MSNFHRCLCGKLRTYSFRYDAFFCADSKCDRWLTAKCDDAACIFCAERPLKPSGLQPVNEHAKNPKR